MAHAVRSRYARLVSRPEVALLLNVGGLLVLYFTPLYGISTRHEGVHQLVHLHVFATGYLFAWVIAGPDAAPHRASVRARLVTLGAAIAAHASAAQLMYAGLLVQVHEPAAQLRSAGDLMYFGGDIAELALALALLLTWRPSQARRSGAAGANRETANKPAGDLSPTF